LSIGLALMACNLSRPSQIVSPQVVGLIDSVRTESNFTILTVNDQEISLDLSTGGDRWLRGGFAGLLILGDEPERWILTAQAEEPGCYKFDADAAFDEPDAIIVVYSSWKSVGIRLTKASGFEPGTALHRRKRRRSVPNGVWRRQLLPR
jgi:hypothetical protein